MSWLRRHQFHQYVLNSIWPFPVLSILAGILTVALLSRIERSLGLTMNVDVDTARAVIGTVAASMFTLVLVGSSAVLLAVQLASAQLTPRIITLLYRSGIRKFSLTAFVFTFTFSVGVLVRIEQSVPLVTAYLAAYGFLVNLALFIFFIDGMGKTLRPSSALQVVARAGREVIHNVYPQRLEKHSAPPETMKSTAEKPSRIVYNGSDGVVLAFDKKGLVSLAQRSNCLIELIPEVGDFVAAGDSLFRIFEGGSGLDERTLRNSVALGQERTFEQDPMFAFRVMVDIASKALSPAVNDPTTAVLAIDQIHHLLRDVGTRYLAEGVEKDGAGRVRLIYRTPNWEDFISLAVTEIRQYGATSIQVTRRLQAMLENLIETLPERRVPPLYEELQLLHNTVQRSFGEPIDRLRAGIGDLQGVGGRPEENQKRGGQAKVVTKPDCEAGTRAFSGSGRLLVNKSERE